VGLSLFAVYLVVQVLVAAEFGVVNGNKASQELTVQGQLVVNVDRVPEASRRLRFGSASARIDMILESENDGSDVGCCL
jgi:hypothetical protein